MAEEKKTAAKKATKKAAPVEEVKAPVEEAPKKAAKAKKEEKKAEAPKKPAPTEARAIAKNVRLTPRKARLVIDLVRGKSVKEALGILANTNRAASSWHLSQHQPCRFITSHQTHQIRRC